MERKDFIKKGLMGTGIFVASAAFGNVLKNEVDELKELEPMGFNHLPNTDSGITANMVLHKAGTRGHADHGWLDSRHTFSFANYYNPERMHFGVLRVLNDDRVDPGKGFGTHPHDNMEIISIPLEGDLEHKDSMDNIAVIREGDIQAMSAGTGIFHSEFNKNNDRDTRFLQIWLFPRTRNVTPRYDQITLNTADRRNRLQQVLSPDPGDEGVWIHQDAWFHMGRFDKGATTDYTIKRPGNGIYLFIIRGGITVGGQELAARDGLGIWNTASISLTTTDNDTEILLMDIPMSLA